MPTLAYPEIKSPYATTVGENTNWVTDEVHTLNTTLAIKLVRPNFGSFFRDELVVYSVASGGAKTLLNYGTDYKLIEMDVAASETKGFFVYKYIQITKVNVQSVSLSLHYVGGTYSNPMTVLVSLYEKLAEIEAQTATAQFSQLANLPTYFPAAPTPIDMENTYNWGTVVSAINDLKEVMQLGNYTYIGQLMLEIKAMMQSEVAALSNQLQLVTNHISANGNVHNTTKTDLAMEKVSNLYPSNSSDVASVVSTTPIVAGSNKYVTTQMLQAYHAQFVKPLQ